MFNRPPPAPPLPPSTPVAIRILTHNLGGDPSADNLKPCESLWPHRLPLIVSQTRFHTLHNPAAIFCAQEVQASQLPSLLAGLNSRADDADWAYVGPELPMGRWREWNWNAIFYRTTAWRVKNVKTTWLSQTPDVKGSVGWDAKCPRTLTAALLEHLGTGKKVAAMCTHFDHKGEEAREMAALLVASQGVESVLPTGGRIPAFVAGDFNCGLEDPAWMVMSMAEAWTDAAYAVREVDRYGCGITATGYGSGKGKGHIDYVFVNKEIEVKNYGVLPNRFDDGLFSSDHRAVVVDVML